LSISHPAFYTVVEKILEGSERMVESWAVHGTTGYEFVSFLHGVLVDKRNAQEIEVTLSLSLSPVLPSSPLSLTIIFLLGNLLAVYWKEQKRIRRNAS
jgi:hypothetical protein